VINSTIAKKEDEMKKKKKEDGLNLSNKK